MAIASQTFTVANWTLVNQNTLATTNNSIDLNKFGIVFSSIYVQVDPQFQFLGGLITPAPRGTYTLTATSGNVTATTNVVSLATNSTRSALNFIPASNAAEILASILDGNSVEFTFRGTRTTPEQLRLGGNKIHMALGSNKLAGAALGGTKIWEPPPAPVSEGFAFTRSVLRAGATFFEATPTQPTRLDAGVNLRGVLLSTTAPTATIWFDEPLIVREASFAWDTDQQRMRGEGSLLLQQEFSVDLSTEAVATLGTVSGLYRYEMNLTGNSEVGSLIANIPTVIAFMNTASTNNFAFRNWNCTLRWSPT
ncbi:MAG: hypothetical protein OXC91_05625 [Rhodobacteraceae bacterium]|nr:hypothetical protein [Paracoccaceae bacterium]